MEPDTADGTAAPDGRDRDLEALEDAERELAELEQELGGPDDATAGS